MADFFAWRRISLHVNWLSPHGTSEVFGLMFTRWEFFFLLSSIQSLYALHRLAIVDEPGSVERRELVGQIWQSARRSLRNASSVAGLRLAVSFPGADLVKSRERPAFLLEHLLRRRREDEEPVSPLEAIGTLPRGAFRPAPPDHSMDDLLSKLRRLDDRAP
jgi:hypothetical protein